MKIVGITKFRKNMFALINSLKKGERLNIMKNDEVVGVFIKK